VGIGRSKNLTVQRLEAAYLAGFEAMDRVEARHAQNKTDTRFTPDGVKDDLLKFVLNEAVPALHQSRMTIRKAKDEVAERRGKLKLAGPDKSDIAGALRRQEIRQRLSAMKPDEQAGYFMRYGDNLPVEIAQAVVELPAEFSNVPQSRHDLLTESALNEQFGPAIEEIKELEQAIAAAESSVEAARDEVRLETGIHDVAFNELAAPIERKHSAPWLRRTKDGVVVVDLEKRCERTATSAEIEAGVYYKNFDDYSNRKDDAA
jgi:predicted  nucleic acid-binding Zn-ribbon protein